MRRAFLSSALLAGGLFAAACTEQRSPLPTEAPRFDLSPSSCPTAAQIDAMITALFPTGDLLMSAQDFFNNIKTKVNKGDPATLAMAPSKTLKFVDFTINNYRRGKLLDPNGGNPPTTQAAVVDLINALFCFPFPQTSTSLPTDQLGRPGSSGGSSVIGSDGGKSPTGEAQPLAGLVVPAGAVSSDPLFAIARHDELTPPGQPSQCLGATNATAGQYPLCYNYSVFPMTDFAQEVILAVCQVEPPPPQPIRGRLRLAHPNPAGGILFTRLVADPFPLLCTNAAVSTGTGGIGVLLKRLGSFAARVVGPKMLFAGHAGLGGSTCCFSNFIAVDSAPDLIIAGMSHSPTNPTTADPITVTAVVQNIGAAPAGPSTVAFAVGIPTPPTASVPALGVGASFAASVTVAARPAGIYQDTATADFGDAIAESNESNNTSISAAYTVAVPTTTSLATSTPLAIFGTPVTLTATVSPVPPAGESPMVQFFDGTTSLGTASVGAGGAASLATSSLSLAAHSLTAHFLGTVTFASSTSSVVAQHLIRRFDDLSSFTAALGGASTATQDFESFAFGTAIGTIISGVLNVTSPFATLEVFDCPGRCLFGFDDVTRVAGNGRYDLLFVATRNALGFDVVAKDPATGPAHVDVVTSVGTVTFDVQNVTCCESNPVFFGAIASTPPSRVSLREGPEISGTGNEEVALDNIIVAFVTLP